MPLGRRILALCALCGLAWSQTAWGQTGLTTIQDTLFKADGTRFTGTLTIQWSTFDVTNVGTIVQQSRSVPVVNGNLQVQLAPNATAPSPANTYAVTYQSDGTQQFAETWTVPVSATALTVRDVRTGSGTSSGGGTTGNGNGSGGSSGPIAESGVTGLVSDLGQRPTRGAAFGAGGVAIVDNNGILETAVGQVGDCVMVDGTTGPCGAATYADAETPGGLVDGSNTSFTLANTPSGTSLMMFRNGLYQTMGFDYTLTGSTIQFGTGAVPQPGDTLTTSYRVDPSAAGAVAQVVTLHAVRSTTTAQVICNATGIGTRIGVWTTLGSCDLPLSQLGAGDRIELRFSFTHTGHLSGFDLQINWGATTILARHGGAQDAAVVGVADASITTTGTLLTVQSWGTVLQFLPGVLNAPLQNGVGISLSATAGASTTDSVQLANFTVLRYPAN
jgi:hypothetical protein